MVRLSGLWKPTNPSNKVIASGSLGTAKLVILNNPNKTGPNSPDYILYITEKDEPLPIEE